MKNNNSQQVENLFHAALQFEVADRASYLEQSCLGNDALAREVQSLLDALENSNGFMEEPAFDLGLKLMGDNAKQALTGQQIGAYKILRLLGQGGMYSTHSVDPLRMASSAFRFSRAAVAEFAPSARMVSFLLRMLARIVIFSQSSFQVKVFVASNKELFPVSKDPPI